MTTLDHLVECDVMPLIISFLGFYEATTNLSLVKKSYRKKVLDEYFPRVQGVAKGKPEEESGRLFCGILDLCRVIALESGLVAINPKAAKLVEQTQSPANCLQQAGYMADLMKLNVAIYSYWGSTSSTPKSGIFHLLNDHCENNMPVMAKCHKAVMKDCVYWQSSRIFGNFIVLFERSDGTVLVSEDLQQVYLVLGIAQSLGEVLTPPYARIPLTHPQKHGPFIGRTISTTLLNWQDKILYDGLLTSLETKLTKAHIQHALQAYIHAIDTDSIITRLEKKPPAFPIPQTKEELKDKKKKKGKAKETNNTTSTSSTTNNREEILLLQRTHATVLSRIQSQPSSGKLLHISQMIVFRRFGYTEEENPSHQIALLCGSNPLYCTITKALIPSIEEYLTMIVNGICEPLHEKPSHIAIDTIEQVAIMQALLTPIGITVHYYPPPSPEEQLLSNLTNPLLSPSEQRIPCCAVCRSTRCPDGKALLRCGRCQSVCYCCKEHQKEHWSKHKRQCTPLPAPSSSSSF